MSALAGLGLLIPVHATASESPAVKASSDNKVASCATPGRLMAFVKSRNEKLDPRFEEIATDYQRHGDELSMRWDYAFFQMLVETGNLKFGGDVKPSQNNFAGLGATGKGERGETFKDVSTGVRAHLEHLLMYTGEKVANPVAERTRKVQEWGVLTDWQKGFNGPLTFAGLARKWAPPARKYAQEIDQVAETFMDGPCKAADPHPELVAAAGPGKTDTAAKPAGALAPEAAAAPKVIGADIAKRAVDEARADGSAKRSALGAGRLGAGAAAKSAAIKEGGAGKEGDTKPDVKAATLLNPQKPADETPSSALKAAAPAVAKGAKPACKVFTASYGGAKAIIIKATTGEGTNYTVLDVNEGAESREAEAYIAAYAPGGKQVGEFKTQNQALDKAFELCPEG